MNGKKKAVIPRTSEPAKPDNSEHCSPAAQSESDLKDSPEPAHEIVSQPQTPEKILAPAEPPGPPQAQDNLNWSEFAFELELEAIARQIVLNSVVSEFHDNRLKLAHPPELELMLKPEIKKQIQASIERKLAVSLVLEFVPVADMDAETPHQADIRRQEEHRMQAVERIRNKPLVSQLHRLFHAELIESSVQKQNSQ